jgi:serine/threonine protein kinase
MRPLLRSPRLFTLTPKPAASPKSGDLEPEANPVIAGYRIGDLLGQGPLGKVYHARHEQSGQMVVFRGFARPDDAEPQQWEQAKNQFRDLLAAHQRIADQPDAPSSIQKVVAFGEENGLFWIATEYFDGISLRNVLDKERSLPMTRIIELMRQIAEAVDWMGNQGLPHTDLNPHNIILVSSESNTSGARIHVEVINFGLAHARSKYGSPYAAPEQMEGAAGDRRADVYAIGALLHEMLTGVPLFSGDTPEEITQKVLYSPPHILIQRPQSAYKIVTAMVARKPEWRYQTVGEAITDLLNNREPRFAVPDSFSDATPPLSPLPSNRAPATPVPTAAPIPIYIPEPGQPAVSGPSVSLLSPQINVRRPSNPEITLQNYKLSDQDVIILRWRLQQEQRRKEEAREAQRERWMPWIQRGAVVGIIALLAVVVMNWRNTYQYLIVERVNGQVSIKENGVNHLLKGGEWVRADHHPIIHTGSGSSVALAMPDGRLYLPQNSALGLLRLDYNNGTIRHLELLSGSVVGLLEKGHRIRRFDVRVANTLTTVKGTYFFLTLARGSLIAGSKKGKLQIESNGDKQAIPEGSAAVLTANNSVLQMVPAASFSSLTIASEKVLTKVAPTTPPPLAALEEKTVAPVLSLGDTLWKLPTKANDQKSIGLSMAGMNALCTLLATADSGEGLPESLDLTTLKELGMEDKDRQRILNLFDENRLLSYRRLPGNGYEIYARCKDSDHTLMRGSNGQVEVIANDDGADDRTGNSPDMPPSDNP